MRSAYEIDTKAGQTHVCALDDERPHGFKSLHMTVFCECGCAWRSTDVNVAMAMANAHIVREACRPSATSSEGGINA